MQMCYTLCIDWYLIALSHIAGIYLDKKIDRKYFEEEYRDYILTLMERSEFKEKLAENPDTYDKLNRLLKLWGTEPSPKEQC